MWYNWLILVLDMMILASFIFERNCIRMCVDETEQFILIYGPGILAIIWTMCLGIAIVRVMENTQGGALIPLAVDCFVLLGRVPVVVSCMKLLRSYEKNDEESDTR